MKVKQRPIQVNTRFQFFWLETRISFAIRADRATIVYRSGEIHENALKARGGGPKMPAACMAGRRFHRPAA